VGLCALVTAGALVASAASAASAAAVPIVGTSGASAPAKDQTFLVVADPAAAAVHVFRAKDLRRTGSLTALEGAAHCRHPARRP
jgi:hypothetical protein